MPSSQGTDYCTSPLCAAADNGDLALVKDLIQQGADVNENNPILYAANKGHIKIVEYLIEIEAKKDATNKFGFTLLHIAAYNGDIELLDYYLSKEQLLSQINIDKTDVANRTALHYAAHNGHQTIVERLLQEGANIEAADTRDFTPLYHAVDNGHTHIISLLMQCGANANKEATSGGCTSPLSLASRKDDIAIVKCLVEWGADINITYASLFGGPLHEAAFEGHITVLKYFIQHKADLCEGDHQGYTPLHYAVFNGQTAAVQLFMESKVDPDVGKRSEIQTALYFAVQQGDIAIVECLLQYGANPKLAQNALLPLETATSREIKKIGLTCVASATSNNILRLTRHILQVTPQELFKTLKEHVRELFCIEYFNKAILEAAEEHVTLKPDRKDLLCLFLHWSCQNEDIYSNFSVLLQPKQEKHHEESSKKANLLEKLPLELRYQIGYSLFQLLVGQDKTARKLFEEYPSIINLTLCDIQWLMDKVAFFQRSSQEESLKRHIGYIVTPSLTRADEATHTLFAKLEERVSSLAP